MPFRLRSLQLSRRRCAGRWRRWRIRRRWCRRRDRGKPLWGTFVRIYRGRWVLGRCRCRCQPRTTDTAYWSRWRRTSCAGGGLHRRWRVSKRGVYILAKLEVPCRPLKAVKRRRYFNIRAKGSLSCRWDFRRRFWRYFVKFVRGTLVLAEKWATAWNL